jgi:hypothetical protein
MTSREQNRDPWRPEGAVEEEYPGGRRDRRDPRDTHEATLRSGGCVTAPMTSRGGFAGPGALGSHLAGVTPYRTGPHHGKGPKGYRRSDERIQADVSDELMRDGYLDASDVTVQVRNGEVTLEGTVPDHRAKRDAADCAQGVLGVVDVLDLLEVREVAVLRGRKGERPVGFLGEREPASRAKSNS